MDMGSMPIKAKTACIEETEEKGGVMTVPS
jgi:hypothetical protein